MVFFLLHKYYMAKRRNISGKLLRESIPQPKDVAEFIAPRTVEDGLSIANVFGDVGDMIDPFITAAIEKQHGLRDVSDDELKLLAALGSIPVAGAAATKITKKLNKLVPNPKGGFIQLKKPVGDNKLKDVIEASNEAGQKITPEIEKEIREHIGIINDAKRNPSSKAERRMVNHYDNMSIEARQVIDGYLGQEQMHGFKPEGFDTWSPDERISYLNDKYRDLGVEPQTVYDRAINLKNENYGGNLDYGVIYPDKMTTDDYIKAYIDKKKEIEAAKPITTTQVEDLSNGIVQTPASQPKGGKRNKYDHSRQFMDTELKQVPGIDRTGMSYGDNTDAFYDIYKAWRDNPGKEHQAIAKLQKKSSKLPSINTDPYYNAGRVGDKNVRLWDKIENLRAKGISDSEIRELLKTDLDKYQGSIERYKMRANSKEPLFYLDGAQQNYIDGMPSEKARALKALGIDTPEYDELEQLGNFYRVFFPQ